MDLKERDERIYKLRKNGATFSHIALIFNISRSRAQQIYARAKFMKEQFDALPPLMKLLSKRTQKAFNNYFIDENILGNPKKIAGLGKYGLLKIKNIGRKSLIEIASALYEIGYDDDWLEAYRNDKESRSR